MKSVKAEKLYRHIPDKTEKRIKDRVYSVAAHLDAAAYRTSEPVPYQQREKGDRFVPKIGETWGKLFDCAWFNFTGVVPESCKGKKVVLILDVGGEGCVFDKEGNPVRGITTKTVELSASDWGIKRVVQFAEKAAGGERVDVWADCGNNDLFGNAPWGEVQNRPNSPFMQADIAVCDDEIRNLYYDYQILNNLIKNIDDESVKYYSALYALIGADRALKDFTPAEIAAARKILKTELDKKGETPSLEFSTVGHAHLDLAWLWPIRESKRKAARTFSTALELFERYPEYIFCASQPQQWEWMKEEHPGLYARMKKYVAAGRLIPEGCMWVEPDTNVPGGESLARQILYGKKFFKDEFGKDIEILWIPDVFGFSAALPQLCVKAGVKYLLTIKISWNRFTVFPYHTFRWRGLSDDEIIVHMPPNGNYNGEALPGDFLWAAKNYAEKGKIQNALLTFGIGDGGGGPAPKHLEALKRMKNLAGVPPVKQESGIEFFKRLDKQADKMDVYCGEMYLENHQGTYTTQGKNKYYNRRMETLLHNAEAMFSIDGLSGGGNAFPKAEIDKIWKEVLLYQFHDILPGSSIKRVYNETAVAYKAIEAKLERYIEGLRGKKPHNAVFNPLGFEVKDIAENCGKYYSVTAAPLGYTLLEAGNEITKFNSRADGGALSNDILTAKFDKDGALVSFIRKTDGRNALRKEGGNILNVYRDRGDIYNGDAWDMDHEYYLRGPERFKLTGVKTYRDGPYAVREQRFAYNKSTFTQKIKLKHGGEYLEFENTVDWQEEKKMLRAEFYADADSGFVKCGIQFGHIMRTTKQNTPADFMQYEICAHRYAQLSEGNFNVALMSDCKYGYRAKGSLISLNLLRSPEYPAAEHMGEHTFRYALYAGEGAGDVERQSYAFINGLYTVYADKGFSLASADKENIMIETVKPAEDGKGGIIRLYENRGQKTAAKLTLNKSIKKAYLCDLTENVIKELPIKDGAVILNFKSFEIHTVKIARNL